MEPFCYWHIETQENPEGTDCSAHLNEGRCYPCPYTLEKIRFGPKFGKEPELYISHDGDPLIGACQDFKPAEGIDEKSLIRKIVEQNQLSVR